MVKFWKKKKEKKKHDEVWVTEKHTWRHLVVALDERKSNTALREDFSTE